MTDARAHSAPAPLPATAAALWALPAIVFAAIVYFPVTGCYFYLDDFLNLFHIVNDSPLQYLVRENGGHILLTRNALFYLTFQLAGPTPELFYWSAYLTHLVNVGLLFLVIVRFTGRAGLASFGAAFWGISPLNEGALGWYSVYGHAVVGTILLIILVQASRCVETRRPPSRRMRILWFVLALMAASSFGTGVGIAMALPFVLWLVLYPVQRLPPLLSLVIAVPALYAGLTRLFEYTSRSEAPARTLAENLLSSLPAVWRLFHRVAGFGIAEWATGFVLPTPGPPDGWTIALSVTAAALAIAIVLSPAPVRRQLLACALIVASAYGIIAMGRGALMESAQDELVESLTRYHYAAPIALTIMLCLGLAQVARRIDGRIGAIAVAVWYVIAGISYARSSFVIELHKLERNQTRHVLKEIRTAIDAQPPGSTVRMRNVPFPPFPLGSFVPGYAGAFTMFYPDNVVDGRRVEFVEYAKYIVEGNQHGRRISRVLVSP